MREVSALGLDGPPKDKQEMTSLLRAAVERGITFSMEGPSTGWSQGHSLRTTRRPPADRLQVWYSK